MRNWIVWHYTFGVNCKQKFNRSHAHIFYYVLDPKVFIFNADAVRVPSARQTTYADRRANPVGKLPDDTWVLRPQEGERCFEADSDTWYVARVCGTFKERTGHPCQMPEAVLERIIRVSSNPGDLVLDPFAGSGTTLATAKRLERRYLGIELSPEYAEAVRERPGGFCPSLKRQRSCSSLRLRFRLGPPPNNQGPCRGPCDLGVAGQRGLRRVIRPAGLPRPRRGGGVYFGGLRRGCRRGAGRSERRPARLGTQPAPRLGVALLLARWGHAAGLLGLAATAAACSWLPLGDLGPGYFAWLGSMGLLTAAGAWCATQPVDDEIL